jgi:hypothetical protein
MNTSFQLVLFDISVPNRSRETLLKGLEALFGSKISRYINFKAKSLAKTINIPEKMR